jgi:hypothetical protein
MRKNEFLYYQFFVSRRDDLVLVGQTIVFCRLSFLRQTPINNRRQDAILPYIG